MAKLLNAKLTRAMDPAFRQFFFDVTDPDMPWAEPVPWTEPVPVDTPPNAQGRVGLISIGVASLGLSATLNREGLLQIRKYRKAPTAVVLPGMLEFGETHQTMGRIVCDSWGDFNVSPDSIRDIQRTAYDFATASFDQWSAIGNALRAQTSLRHNLAEMKRFSCDGPQQELLADTAANEALLRAAYDAQKDTVYELRSELIQHRVASVRRIPNDSATIIE